MPKLIICATKCYQLLDYGGKDRVLVSAAPEERRSCWTRGTLDLWVREVNTPVEARGQWSLQDLFGTPKIVSGGYSTNARNYAIVPDISPDKKGRYVLEASTPRGMIFIDLQTLVEKEVK
ncbi:hypothetical protein COY27_02245 [Candidatus Woesearchaeota archaeon CG_4_10_14_0_2_um_filter_33_13]|nr:MAG: hypothetical protein COY27_02245 [Candidatus Woesearchaeota archaeon CG_4_10_14_0_2_um_filter_33_13]